MQTLNISLNQVNEHLQRLQEVKAFLEGVAAPKLSDFMKQEEAKQPELNITIHEYWHK